MTEQPKRKHKNAGPRDRQARWLELVASGIGVVLAVGTIGVILWHGYTGTGEPPQLTIQVESVTPQNSGGYLVQIIAQNTGGETAAQVLVTAELERDGETVETSEIVFDYVPSMSQRRGGLVFSRDPRSFDLTVRAAGYIAP